MNVLSQKLPTLEQIKNERARRSLHSFTTRTKPDYQANWHHKILCNYLERWAFGDLDRLMIFLPPRNGKSELVSRRLPAWILGHDPDASIIACSYGADLASRMNRDVQRIIDSPEYSGIFPGTRLNGGNVRSVANGSFLRNSDIFEIVDRKGVYKSAGVGGAITGMGMKYGIIDDPFKNRQEANSATNRQKVWDWYTSTFYTRLEKGGKILITLTRWHEDDIAGRLLEQEEKGQGKEGWEVLKFPAIATDDLHPEDPREEGQPLWEDKYSLEDLERTKAALGPLDWESLHQQNPQPLQGALLKRKYWKYYTVRPDPSIMDRIILSWDCTFKDLETSDYVVGQVWGKKGPDFFLLDQIRDKMGIIATMDAIRQQQAMWRQAMGIYIEDKANGTPIIEMLKQQIPGINAVEPHGGKVVRAQAVLPFIAAGNVWLPDPTLEPWVAELVKEAAAFPHGKNDDTVDSMTQALKVLSDDELPFIGRA